MGDIISSIGISIGIGTAVADSIGYRAPAWYRSNPTDVYSAISRKRIGTV